MAISCVCPRARVCARVCARARARARARVCMCACASSYQKPTQITIAIMMGCTSNQDLVMISHHNIRGYRTHKTELQAFLEDHSPDVVTLNETFTKKGYKYNMPHYTAVTRNREHGKGGA